MQDVTFECLRDLVLHYAAERGWRTQRHIAVMCGLDETALSRFLNGEQDIGARRTHTLFQAVGIPVEHYDLAYALLGRAQELARGGREARPGRGADAALAVRLPPQRSLRARRDLAQPLPGPRAMPSRLPLPAPGREPWRSRRPVLTPAGIPALEPGPDIPAAVVIALFAERGYSGQEIAGFFAGA